MDKILINKFLTDRCNPEEEAEMMEWIHLLGYKELGDIIEEDLNKALANATNAEVGLCHLLPDIFNLEQDTYSEKKNQPNKIVSSIKLSAAGKKREVIRVIKWVASIIIILGSTYVFYKHIKNTIALHSNDTVELVTKTNQRGRRSTIHLKDGSIVYLNSESKITYPSVFSDSLRIVQLEGEAFFDIVKDKSRPFIVRTGSIQAKVLGTSFNVNAFKDNDEIKVSLVSGQVELSHENNGDETDNTLLLSPNQSVVYQSSKNVFNALSGFDPKEEYGWKEGIIYFNKAGLITVINKLEQWYNIQIEVKNDPPLLWSYTGSFKNETLENILNTIGHTEGFHFKMEGDKVIIKFKSDDYDTNS